MSSQVALIGITGATGFVGGAVVHRLLAADDCALRLAVRTNYKAPDGPVEIVSVGALAPDTQWDAFTNGLKVVIHAAARVHVLNESASDPDFEFQQANVLGTLRLAEQAAAAGVKRFIFISSIKVNGEATVPGSAYAADGPCQPQDPYGVSKMKAEEGLRQLAARTGMEVVIIRPVLVYGPGVKANFLNMMRWLDKSIPLPLGSIDNRRSLVALDNLVDLIATCVNHPAAANQTFLVSDGRDVSTTELLRLMAAALGKPARLLPVPMGILNGVAALLGKKAVSQRLCGSLQVDISKTRTLLGWAPPVSLEEAMKKTAQYYLDHENHA